MRTTEPSGSVAAGSPGGASSKPAAASTALRVTGSIGAFFGEAGSMQGGMMATRSRSRPSQT